jgi:hypothetical protein
LSPFFFWGTAMVAMKGVIPRMGPFVVAVLRLLPAGTLLVTFVVGRSRRKNVNVCEGAGADRGGIAGKRQMRGRIAAKKNESHLGYSVGDSVFFHPF